MPFATLSDLLKRAMLGAAERAAGVPATDSRLSLMTGLQRRDIARLRATAPPAEAPPAPHLARLVGLWLGDPAYAGRPVARKGPAPSFDDLPAGAQGHPRQGDARPACRGGHRGGRGRHGAVA
ncbi:MAG: hypothetical protein JKP98_01110 [Rhodobacteraceae bacterium]|nr:hypothetical protein [Paracoccaceae bacterium]